MDRFELSSNPVVTELIATGIEKEELMRSCRLCVLMLMIVGYINISYAQSIIDPANKSYYTIGGEIHLKEIKKNGNLYISLVTEETFKTPLHGFKKLILEISEKEISQKKVSFHFLDIPPGRYGIRCFFDADGNEKLNKGMFGPSEPWGMSWQGEKALGWPKFKHIAFAVNMDLMDIQIVVE